MRTTLITLLTLSAFVLSSCCTDCRPDINTIQESKTTLMKHNYIIVNSIDNTPTQVEVNYSIFIEGNMENIIRKEILTTPFLIGGENVKVVYDSVTIGKRKHITDRYGMIKRNYNPLGADYLSIKNLSSKELEYCVIGCNKLTFKDEKELEQFKNFSGLNTEDRKKVIHTSPLPLYRGGPVVYLLKPKLAVSQPFFITNYIDGEYFPKKIDFKGDLTDINSFSMLDLLGLYREEYNNGNILFSTIESYYEKKESISQEKIHNLKCYGIIRPNEILNNSGQIWFLNSYMGRLGRDEINGRFYN
ncbi:hypothetical protein ACI76O_01895 [Capnocytophaga cynodegmi]|uniref:hypothetical protein n=1 Tax=Capnocytophaga cynodegmi TaxID=28189 RepID=UPI001AC8CFB1|nr:hypothetical protein [Capnocytophaga cynodegmi]GIM51342.1 hypothetical protein CAPN004_03720 [Capnocytophaga cynodegmi]